MYERFVAGTGQKEGTGGLGRVRSLSGGVGSGSEYGLGSALGINGGGESVTILWN